MELKQLRGNMGKLVSKYKYAVLILLIGLALMLIPTHSEEKTQTENILNTPDQPTLQQQLQSVLSQVQGAGAVEVILNERTGQHTLYQTNEDISVSQDSTVTKVETVTLSGVERDEFGLIRQVNPATYQGALILCQGAEDPNVRLAITEAVSKLTGLGADKIAILKMK